MHQVCLQQERSSLPTACSLSPAFAPGHKQRFAIHVTYRLLKGVTSISRQKVTFKILVTSRKAGLNFFYFFIFFFILAVPMGCGSSQARAAAV